MQTSHHFTMQVNFWSGQAHQWECDVYIFHLFTLADVKPHSVPVPAPMEIPMAAGSEFSTSAGSHPGQLPPPYQLLNVPPLEPANSQEDPQDYLLLINCRSKKPEPTR